MPKKYRSGFERLGKYYPDKAERYSQALKIVRENFTGFEIFNGYDDVEQLTEAQQRQIRRYFNLFSSYTEGGPVYRMKPSELPKRARSSRKNIEKVMQAAQMREGRKRSRFVFIRYDGVNKPKVKLRGDTPVFTVGKVGEHPYTKEFIPLSPLALATDARQTIMSLADYVHGFKLLRVANVSQEFYGSGSLKLLADYIERLQAKYAIGTKNDWRRWLTGIMVYYSDAKALEILETIRVGKETLAARIKAERKKIRRKRK